MALGTDPRFVEVWFPDGSALEVDVDARLRRLPGVAEALADWLMSMPSRATAAEALRGRLEPLGLALRIRSRRSRLAIQVEEARQDQAVARPGQPSPAR